MGFEMPKVPPGSGKHPIALIVLSANNAAADVSSLLSGLDDWSAPQNTHLERDFKFADFASALGFTVRLGCYAEKRDHHPDIELGWGRARVLWSTHDAGGITELDLAAAEATDKLTE